MSVTGIRSYLFALCICEVKLFGMTVIRALSVFGICVHSFIALRNSYDKSSSNSSIHYGDRKPFLKFEFDLQVCLPLASNPIFWALCVCEVELYGMRGIRALSV